MVNEMRNLIYFFVLLAPMFSNATSVRSNFEFPQVAIDNCINGKVSVLFSVDKSGKPVKVQIMKSTPEGLYDEVSISNMQKLSFHETTLSGLKIKKGKYIYVLKYEAETFCKSNHNNSLL